MQLLVGIAAAQLAGQDFLVGLDRVRADVAGQLLAPVPGLASTTAAGLARRCTDEHWRGVEPGLAAVHERMLSAAAAAARGRAVRGRDDRPGHHRRGGVRAQERTRRLQLPGPTRRAPARGDLGRDRDPAGRRPRRRARRPPRHRRRGVRPGAGRVAAPDPAASTVAGARRRRLLRRRVARAARTAGSGSRSAPNASPRCGGCSTGCAKPTGTTRKTCTTRRSPWPTTRPRTGPTGTRLLIRRVRLTPDQISADARSRRRRTLHPDQRALPLEEIAELDAIYGYSFVVTDLDVSTPEQAVEVEHWYRHRTTIENVFRDSKHGAALRQLPSGYHSVNTAWMWGALLAAATAGWCHQLTAERSDDDTRILAGHGVDGGKAMIATLRRRVVAVPGRVIRHARTLTLRLPPGDHLIGELLTRTRALPAPG